MRRLFAITFLALFAFTGTAFAEIGFKWKSKITGVKCSKKCKTKCKNFRVKRCRLYKKYVKRCSFYLKRYKKCKAPTRKCWQKKVNGKIKSKCTKWRQRCRKFIKLHTKCKRRPKYFRRCRSIKKTYCSTKCKKSCKVRVTKCKYGIKWYRSCKRWVSYQTKCKYYFKRVKKCKAPTRKCWQKKVNGKIKSKCTKWRQRCRKFISLRKACKTRPKVKKICRVKPKRYLKCKTSWKKVRRR